MVMYSSGYVRVCEAMGTNKVLTTILIKIFEGPSLIVYILAGPSLGRTNAPLWGAQIKGWGVQTLGVRKQSPQCHCTVWTCCQLLNKKILFVTEYLNLFY